ncbi:MAG: phosphoribosylamine--glycine ligase [Kiritimatiellae bacterium]|nr:phosphoribosylamine--glycine ligase [Kiritimatiellia bacterium]
MKILVVGSGGREPAIAWRLARDEKTCPGETREVYCAPGNAGTVDVAANVDIAASDIEGIVAFAKEKSIELVVVGPEAPLVKGLADALAAENIPVFGPVKAGAMIEGSKAFAKDVMAAAGVPTARAEVFTDAAKAKAALDAFGLPVVIKADGLAAGKGVIIASTREEADATIDDMLVANKFGDAGASVLIEEFLEGEECSILALTDGERVATLPSAQDHKRIGEGDTGLNTGGMGACSPSYVVKGAKDIRKIEETILLPVVRELKKRGITYRGVLYAGLMVKDGEAKVLEFNARFGDPETEAVLPRIGGNFAQLLLDCAQGRLDPGSLAAWGDVAATVILASGGYPGAYEKGKEITGLDEAKKIATALFHCGTREVDGKIVTAGGRVLSVTGSGATIQAALAQAYEAADKIKFEGKYLRRDIAHRALAKIPRVGIVMGSDSDWPLIAKAAETLKAFGVAYEARVISAHRTPLEAMEYARTAEERGIEVVIAAAGGAAHLAGSLAANTALPVIGIPVAGGALNGLDALYATVQMPSGVPVATVAVGSAGPVNAALLAVQILGGKDPALRAAFREHKAKLHAKVVAADGRLQEIA